MVPGHALYDTYANKHPVTFLGNLMQHKFHCSDWRLIVKETGIVAAGDGEGDGGGAAGMIGGQQRMQHVICGVWVHGKMLAHAMSASSRYAKITAAKEAMKILEVTGVEEYHEKYGCGCVAAMSEGMEGSKRCMAQPFSADAVCFATVLRLGYVY